MDQVTQLSNDVAALKQAETDLKNRVSTTVQSLQDQITALKSAPAGTDISQQLTDLESTIADLATVAPATTVAAGDGTDSTPATGA